MENLKPCPFCGGEAIIKTIYDTDFNVSCRNVYKCGAMMEWRDTEEEAIYTWNNRTGGGNI